MNYTALYDLSWIGDWLALEILQGRPWLTAPCILRDCMLNEPGSRSRVNYPPACGVTTRR